MVNKAETVNHIISEFRKLAQEDFKTHHDRVGKVIQREQCKRLNFDLATKWYSHKAEFPLENEAHRIL